MHKCMLIEDDHELRNLIVDCLEKYNYTVYSVTDFQTVEAQFQQVKPDFLLLDINLPYYDGFYLCRSIRRKSNVPIIIISARSGDIDQVMAIELGADDYVTKPFTKEVLLAKVKAAIRRSYGEYANDKAQKQEQEQQAGPQTHLTIDGLTLLHNSLELTFGEQILELSKNEYKLIHYFLKNKDRVITREELFHELWDDNSFVDDNTLTVNITRVKNKFLQLGLKDMIKTKRGVGYIYAWHSLEGKEK